MKQRKKILKMLLPFLTAALLCCCSLGVSAATVTVSVDKATLGQGWLCEPIQVEVDDGASAADATILAVGTENLRYDTGNSYLRAVRDESDPKATFPQYIIDAVNLESNYREGADTMNADGRYREGWLGEFDYYNMSGWMVTVNNYFIDRSTADWIVKDGDVIRWQFTVFGWGRDIGEDKVAPPLVPLINKDDLCKKIAAINKDKEAYIGGDATKQRYYDNANFILVTTTATQEQVDMALANLNGVSAEEPTLPDPDYVASDGPNVAAVEAMIDAVGEVTADSGEAIKAARKAYNELLRRLQPQVSNLETLAAAEATYAELMAGIEEVSALIDEIGEVTLDSGEAIAAARAAYEALPEASKKKVENLAVLEAAEAAFNELLHPFSDVKESDYFYNAVLWATQNDITEGVGNGLFGPGQQCSRGQIVTFLWRASGMPEPQTAANPFEDVSRNAYYYKAVCWAVEQNITAGTTEKTFSPHKVCGRGQIVTFLWRAAGSPEPETAANPFVDVKNGDYFRNAVLWAVEKEITKGTNATHFSPNATCNRAQAVTFLFRAQ